MLMKRKWSPILALVLALMLLFSAAPVFADDSGSVNMTQDINSGVLDIDAEDHAGFVAVTLTGQTQVLNNIGYVKVQATDATGLGAGWHITAQATPMTEVTPGGGFASGTSALVLPAGSLTLGAPTVTAVGTTSPAPVVTSGSPWTIDSGSAVTVASAAPNTGMGVYDLQFDSMQLTLKPETTKIDKVNYPSGATPYRSVITWTIVSGP